MTRKVEERSDRRPVLADLREIVAKNRNGLTGAVPLRWHGQTMRFMPRGFGVYGAEPCRFEAV